MLINKIISLISIESVVSENQLQEVVDFLEAPSSLEILQGIKVVLPRFERLIPWFEALGHDSFLPVELQNVLKIVCDAKHLWLPKLPYETSRHMGIRNFLVGSIQHHPLYSVFTEFEGNLHQELLVAPFLALFVIEFKKSDTSSGVKKTAADNIRKLLNPDSVEGRQLQNLYDGNVPDLNDIDQVFNIAKNLKSLRWIGELSKKPRRNSGYVKKHKEHDKQLNQPHSWSGNNHLKAKVKLVKRNPIWKDKNVSLKGLSSEEIGEVEEIILSPPNADFDVDLLQRRLSLYSEMDHQHLLWRWQHLNPNEVSWIKDEITSLIANNELIGLLLGLSICTARSVSELLLIHVQFHPPQTNSTADSRVWLSPGLGVLSHPAYAPLNAFTPDEAQQQILQSINNTVVLSLPDIIKNACYKFIARQYDEQTLGEAFDLTPERAEKLVKEWCAKARERSGFIRITRARIKNWGVEHILGVTHDPALTAHLFWFDSGNSSSVYYANYSSSQLQENYSDGMRLILGNTTPYPYSGYFVGSKLSVMPESVSLWIKNWKEELAAAKQLSGLERLVAEHNHLTIYTVMMLMFTTGHRDVTDPFEDLTRYDEQTGTFVIADKMDGTSDNGRLVWLCETAKMQIKAYVAHLRGLASRLPPYENLLSKRIEKSINDDKSNLPLFFLLEKVVRKGILVPQPIQITPKVMTGLLQLPIPLNWTRHYLSAHLRRAGVPAEYIHYQLDHLQRGQRFDGTYSILSVDDIGEILQPALECLSEQVGWSVITGLKSFPVRESKFKFEQQEWIVGSKVRAIHRNERKQHFKNNVDNIIDRIDLDKITEEHLAAVVTDIDMTFRTEGERLHAQRMIFDVLKQHSYQTEVLMRKQWSLSKTLPNDVSIFSLSHGHNLKQGRKIRQMIRDWAEELSIDCDNNVQWQSLLLASAIFEGGLLQEALQEQLLQKFNSHFYSLNDVFWLEFDDHTYKPAAIRRWLPDPLTTLILLAVRKRFANTDTIISSNIKRIMLKRFGIKSFADLLSIAQALYIIELPAYLAHYAAGQLQSASLPNKAWLRFISGQHFSSVEQDQTNESPIHTRTINDKPDLPAKTSVFLNRTLSYPTGQTVRGQVRQLLSKAEKQPSSYSREKVIEFLNQILVENKPEISVFLTALLEWTLLLLNKGRAKPRLVISTVRDYYLKIGRHLYEVTWHHLDFSELDEEDFIRIYSNTLEFTTIENRPSNATLLEDFHRFIQKQYDVPIIDFNEIEPNRKGVSVRPNLLLENEYRHVCSQLPRDKRSAMMLAYRGRMRGKEIRQISISDIHLNALPVITIRSVANKKTKSVAGIRQYAIQQSVAQEEIEDLNEMVELCRLNGMTSFSEIFADDYNQALQQKIRQITGDESMVSYDMRHSAATLSILKSTLPKSSWPFGLADAETSSETIEDTRQYYFGATHKTRRLLFQEALQTGHRSPATTLSSYTHHLDWALHDALVQKQTISYTLLECLTELPQVTFRKLRHQNNEQDYVRKLMKKISRLVKLEEPLHAKELLHHNALVKYIPSIFPESLTYVLEVIRLYEEGFTTAVIAQKMELDEEAIIAWLKRKSIVETQSGYRLNKLPKEESWLSKKFASALTFLEKQVCCDEPSKSIVDLLKHFVSHYQSHLETVFFDQVDLVENWFNSLQAYGISPADMTLVVPNNHSFWSEQTALNNCLHNLGISSVQRMSRGVNSRGWQAIKTPGLGVSITRNSDIDGRVSVQKDLNLLLFSACCLIELF